MKAAIALLVVAFTATAVFSAAPTTDARPGVCIESESCHGLVCYDGFCSSDLNPVCVREPCPRPIP